MKPRQMEKFEQLISPLSWLFLLFGFLPLIFVIFRPSFWEYVVLFLVDSAAFVVASAIDRRAFLVLYPDCRMYFPATNSDALARCTFAERVGVFQSMIRFPARRAMYCALVSFIKAIPAGLVVVFYWKHITSPAVTAAELVFCMCIMYSYFYGAVFIENHSLVSRRIAEFHTKYDWAEVFQGADLASFRRDFEVPEVAALVAIWFFVLILQWVLITGGGTHSTLELALLVMAVGVAGLSLISRIRFLGRDYFVGGLEAISEALASFDPETFQKTLPLHSSAVLGHFEKVFNALIDRLRSYREELFRWINYQAEDSRLRAIGEVSALIVHELSAPIHVIQFCVEELSHNPERIGDARYLEQLSTNGKRSLELIETLRAYLRGPSMPDAVSDFDEAYRDAIRFVEGQVSSRELSRIRIVFQPEPKVGRLKISKGDLVHVLLNLLGNSAKNLMNNSIPEPRIEVGLRNEGEAVTVISVRDNGTGLSAMDYEKLTALTSLSLRDQTSQSGLGLRLVRRLVEQNGGKLEVVDLPPGEHGTLFLLSLKRA